MWGKSLEISDSCLKDLKFFGTLVGVFVPVLHSSCTPDQFFHNNYFFWQILLFFQNDKLANFNVILLFLVFKACLNLWKIKCLKVFGLDMWQLLLLSGGFFSFLKVKSFFRSDSKGKNYCEFDLKRRKIDFDSFFFGW